MSEDGKKRLRDLAQQVRAKVAATGAPLLNQRGLDIVEDLAKELMSPEGMPGLKLYRDSATKFRLARANRNAEISVEWERDIGALGLGCQKHGEPRTFVRYVWDEGQSKWRKLDGGGEIYEDISVALATYLYPEAQKK